MADDVQVKSGVDGAAGSPSAQTQGEVKSPTTENVGTNSNENRIPQSRFNEVIQQRNELEARLRKLEDSQSQVRTPSIVELEAQRLAAKIGAKPEVAAEIVNTVKNLQDAERTAEQMRRQASDAKEWASRKAKEDKEYSNLGPELDKEFSTFSREKQARIAADPELLEMFYGSVKARYLAGKVDEAFNRGKEEAYKSKGSKEGLSSTGGGVAPGGKTALTMDSIQKLTPKEQMERQSEVNEFLRNLGSRK